MEYFILGLCLVNTVLLTGALLLLTLLLVMRHPEGKKAEDPAEGVPEKRRPREDPFEEGFRNIMSFAVNGKTGFEREDEEEEV